MLCSILLGATPSLDPPVSPWTCKQCSHLLMIKGGYTTQYVGNYHSPSWESLLTSEKKTNPGFGHCSFGKFLTSCISAGLYQVGRIFAFLMAINFDVLRFLNMVMFHNKESQRVVVPKKVPEVGLKSQQKSQHRIPKKSYKPSPVEWSQKYSSRFIFY